MLRVLMASQPVRVGWIASTSFSAVTHGALIAIAVATNHAISSVHESRAAERTEHITYISPAVLEKAMKDARAAERAKAARNRAAAEERKRTEMMNALSQLADLKVEVPVEELPELTFSSTEFSTTPDFAPPSMTMAEALGRKNGLMRAVNGVYAEDMVERSIRPRVGNPKPRYPSALANMKVEGQFIVRFVVDSVGNVPEDKIEFPSTMHRLFASSVKTALMKSHYAPAMIAGRFVSMQVVQEFRFEMGRR